MSNTNYPYKEYNSALTSRIGIHKKYSNFNLGSNAALIHIGGWKKLESRKVSKSNFNNLINSFFGIPQQNIFDIFGFTEQMGIIYPSWKIIVHARKRMKIQTLTHNGFQKGGPAAEGSRPTFLELAEGRLHGG